MRYIAIETWLNGKGCVHLRGLKFKFTVCYTVLPIPKKKSVILNVRFRWQENCIIIFHIVIKKDMCYIIC